MFYLLSFQNITKMMMESTDINSIAPSFTLPSISDIKKKFELKRLQRRVHNLEKIYFDNQYLEIIGCEH
jgi:hypothetical protein